MPIVITDATSGGYTFGDLLTEFYARGYDYLNEDAAGQTRAKWWINDAYGELCDWGPWPFLETTVTATAPLAIADFRQAIYVADNNGNTLSPVQPWQLVDWGADLGEVGEPSYYYFDGTTIKTFPTDSNTLTVRYYRNPTQLVNSSDIPIIPSQFRTVIVDGAVVRAYKDTDNFEHAQALRVEWERDVNRMFSSLLLQSTEPTYIDVRG